MRALIPLPRHGLTVWLAAFISPTAYFLLLLVGDALHFPSPPEIVVASLFYLIPPVAVVVCGSVVWLSNMTTIRKTGWLLFTLFAMLLQVGILLAVFIVASGTG